MSDTASTTSSVIVARPALAHRLKMLLAVVLFLGYGLWCIRDGFFQWPAENAKAVEEKRTQKHNEWSLRLNRGLGVVLPPIALYLLARLISRSRGRYQLKDNVLSLPGHPEVPLDKITRIDKRRWQRKGIVEIEYEAPGSGEKRSFILDDFYYQRDPTDAIFERIEQHARQAAE